MVNKKSQTKLKPVKKTDCEFLYELLGERKDWMNISHRKMPSYENHVKFVMSKPYFKWYVIIHKKEKVGTIYLSKQNEIGIFLKKGDHRSGIGKKALNLIMKLNPRPRYLANINPRNTKSMDFFKKNKFKLIQYTYEWNASERK